MCVRSGCCGGEINGGGVIHTEGRISTETRELSTTGDRAGTLNPMLTLTQCAPNIDHVPAEVWVGVCAVGDPLACVKDSRVVLTSEDAANGGQWEAGLFSE